MTLRSEGYVMSFLIKEGEASILLLSLMTLGILFIFQSVFRLYKFCKKKMLKGLINNQTFQSNSF